jgi:hypothetical protein
MVLGGTMMSQRGFDSGGGGVTIIIGLLMMVGIPIFYAIIGFIGGLIGGLVYNGVSGIVGGIELELEDVGVLYAPPPPPQPQQWGVNNPYR